jgi:hypothetical protein
MWVLSTDLTQLVDYLQNKQDLGHTLISYYPKDWFLTLTRLEAFKEYYDARQHSYDNTTGNDICLVGLVEPVLEGLRHLKIQMDGKSLGEVSFLFDIPEVEKQFFINEQFKTNIIMNTDNLNLENLKALEKTFLYTGMKNISRDELINKMLEGGQTFSIQQKEVFGKAIAVAEANCGLSKQGNYFPNTYDMTVQEEGKPDYTRRFDFKRSIPVPIKNEPDSEKKEWINSTITFKEAFNQMQGRAVNKDFVYVDSNDPEKNRKYNAWEYIDFENPDDKGKYPAVKVTNFDIDKEMKDYNLKFPTPSKQDEFMQSLKRGNCQLGENIKSDGTTEKIYFEADPKRGMMKTYDENMNPILLSLKTKQEVSQSPGQVQPSVQSQVEGEDKSNAVKKNQKQDVAGDSDSGPQNAKKTKRKSKGIS